MPPQVVPIPTGDHNARRARPPRGEPPWGPSSFLAHSGGEARDRQTLIPSWRTVHLLPTQDGATAEPAGSTCTHATVRYTDARISSVKLLLHRSIRRPSTWAPLITPSTRLLRSPHSLALSTGAKAPTAACSTCFRRPTPSSRGSRTAHRQGRPAGPAVGSPRGAGASWPTRATPMPQAGAAAKARRSSTCSRPRCRLPAHAGSTRGTQTGGTGTPPSSTPRCRRRSGRSSTRSRCYMGAFSHEPYVLTLPEGRDYVLYKLGCADNATTGSNATWPCRECAAFAVGASAALGIHRSTSEECPLAPPHAAPTECSNNLSRCRVLLSAGPGFAA